MPRKKRIHFPGAIYHVCDRGNGCKDIFHDAMDYQRFLDEMGRLVEFGLQFISYCLMPNHFHLLVRVADAPLSDLMQDALSRYAHYFNIRRGTSGHLFQGRYRADLIDSNAYLLNSIRYLHLNPVVAGLVRNPADWRWSSHAALLGSSDQLVRPEIALSYFGESEAEARQRYLKFLEIPGRAFEVPGAESPSPSRNLDSIARDTAQSFQLSVEELKAPRLRSATRSRRLFIKRAFDCGFKRADVAAFLGCHPTAISKILSRAPLSPEMSPQGLTPL